AAKPDARCRNRAPTRFARRNRTVRRRAAEKQKEGVRYVWYSINRSSLRDLEHSLLSNRLRGARAGRLFIVSPHFHHSAALSFAAAFPTLKALSPPDWSRSAWATLSAKPTPSPARSEHGRCPRFDSPSHTN